MVKYGDCLTRVKVVSTDIFEKYLDFIVLVIDGMQMTKKKSSEVKARFLCQEMTEDLIMFMTNRSPAKLVNARTE